MLPRTCACIQYRSWCYVCLEARNEEELRHRRVRDQSLRPSSEDEYTRLRDLDRIFLQEQIELSEYLEKRKTIIDRLTRT